MERNDYKHRNDWTVKRINKNIRYLCESHRMSLEDLAYKIKIKPERLDFAQEHLEVNVLNDEQVRKICEIFSVSKQELLAERLY